MPLFWELFSLAFQCLPWLAMALLALLVFAKNKKSHALGMQTIGAAAMCLLNLIERVITALLNATGAPISLISTVGSIFVFLIYLSLVVFALGYCMEKLNIWHAKPVTAVPVG